MRALQRELLRLAAAASLVLCVGCGDSDEEPTSSVRGAPPPRGGAPKEAGPAVGSRSPSNPAQVDAAAAVTRPKSEPLTRENFGPETRDPFRSFLADDDLEPIEEAPVVAERQREVRMAGYNFEDLSLVGIIRSKKGVTPRALFVATDGISGAIKQGEYFSRAEVLLSSVNDGYVEIEIVDENLAKGLNLANGETRALYLKSE